MSFLPSVAFLTDSAGTGEWIVVFVVVLIVLGPKKLPEVARKLGRMLQMFRRAADEFKDQIMTMDKEAPSAAESPSVPQTDADGVAVDSSGSSSDSYSDAYPNMSDYPGNEGHVENWSADASAENLAQGGAAGGSDGVAAPQPESGADPEKPAGGAA